MTAKTVSAPSLLGDIVGESAFWLLDGPVIALLSAIVAASLYASLMAKRS